MRKCDRVSGFSLHRYNGTVRISIRTNFELELTKAAFNVKWPFKVIQVHVLCGLWKGDEGINNTA